MSKFQWLCMKKKPFSFISIIKCITRNWSSKSSKMNTDLMCSSGYWVTFKITAASISFYDLKLSNSNKPATTFRNFSPFTACTFRSNTPKKILYCKWFFYFYRILYNCNICLLNRSIVLFWCKFYPCPQRLNYLKFIPVPIVCDLIIFIQWQ